MTYSAKWQDSLAESNPRYRKSGDYSYLATGRKLRRLMEKQARQAAKKRRVKR
tara:strand:- start:43837 stop:43995 length:159 start_codon:yes stop_codon:yes gene_type:complete